VATKSLEKLTLKNGRFFNKSGVRVEARIVGLDTAMTDGQPLFQSHQIPPTANAFAQGSSFDENAGAWSAFPCYVAPTIYLRIRRK